MRACHTSYVRLSAISDSTNHMSEGILEGVSEPQHLASEVVDTEHEATMISNELPSTPSVFSFFGARSPT